MLLLAGAAAFSTSQAIRANQAAEDARSINRFLLDILEQSDPFDAGAEISLSQAIDQAASGLDQRFAARPDLVVKLDYQNQHAADSQRDCGPLARI